jgi:hypothetical protein
MICRTAAELITRSVDATLSVSERVGLRTHTLFCGPCRRFHRQVLRLHVALVNATDGPPPTDDSLSPEARERIRSALDQPPPAGQGDLR